MHVRANAGFICRLGWKGIKYLYIMILDTELIRAGRIRTRDNPSRSVTDIFWTLNPAQCTVLVDIVIF